MCSSEYGRRGRTAWVMGIARRAVGTDGAAPAGAELVDGPTDGSGFAPRGGRHLLRPADRCAMERLSARGVRVTEHGVLLLPAMAGRGGLRATLGESR